RAGLAIGGTRQRHGAVPARELPSCRGTADAVPRAGGANRDTVEPSATPEFTLRILDGDGAILSCNGGAARGRRTRSRRGACRSTRSAENQGAERRGCRLSRGVGGLARRSHRRPRGRGPVRRASPFLRCKQKLIPFIRT